MNRRYRKFMLYAPLKRVAESLGLDWHATRVFSAEAADEAGVLAGRREKPGPKPKGVQWGKVNAIKEYGPDKWANEQLAIYKARLDQVRIDLLEQGVTTEGISDADKATVLAEARGAFSLPAPARP